MFAASTRVPDVGAEAPAAAASFADVYREYFAYAWRTAAALGVPASALDDVAQEIFIIVHQRLATFEGRSSLKSWICGIVLNVVRHRRRTVTRRSPHELDKREPVVPDDLVARGNDPHAAAELSEGTALLCALLAGLEEERREVLVLAELDELSVPEIANALGIKLNTAYSRLRLARADLQAALKRHRAREQRRQP